MGSTLAVLNFIPLMKGVNEELCTTGCGLGRLIDGFGNVGVRFNRCRFRLETTAFGFALDIGSRGGIMISGFKLEYERLDVSITFPVISNTILCLHLFHVKFKLAQIQRILDISINLGKK